MEEKNTDEIQMMRKTRIINIWSARVFFAVFFAAAVFSLALPLRPTYSNSEKRELEKFPKFSAGQLVSGQYFAKINLWFSDTFPFRDFLVDFNTKIHTLFGYTATQIHGDVEEGDEIPDASPPAEPSQTPESSDPTPAEPVPAEPPAPVTQTLGALLIHGDTAYEYYNFVQSVADNYAGVISRAGDMMADRAAVYDIVVPNSMGITAPDEITAGINTSDQRKAIDYMYSRMSANVRTVGVFDALKARREEYLYFRTDHHWTALGAYYTYCELMNKKGIPPLPLESYTPMEFPGYLGTFYSESGKLPQLEARPDSVFAYMPTQTNIIHTIVKGGGAADYPIVSDVSASPYKYLTFIRGDHPFGTIQNPALSDGSACIVVKESYGNAMIPFLVPHYQYIYVVDYRYFSTVDERGLVQLRDETGAQDIIFVNNISATRSKSLVAAMDALTR